MSSPAVSVVVPYFDSEAYIERCLESLHAQDIERSSYELLFIDNGSSDGSPEVVKRYPDVIHLRETKEGAYAARNAGIARVQGEVVAFTDADCMVDPDWVRRAREALTEKGVGIAIGHCRYPSHATPGLKLLERYENSKSRFVARRGRARQQFAYGNNMVVRREVFERLGPFREWKRAADSELVHRMTSEAPELRLAFAPKLRVTHLEFTRAKARAARLRLYSQTNTQIQSFEELSVVQRIQILVGAVLRG